jgi:hypothetical protein
MVEVSPYDFDAQPRTEIGGAGCRRPQRVGGYRVPTKGRRALMISFPNQSRVFDPTRRAVRFWGHDSAMEWSFFVTEDALKRLQPNVLSNEAGLLLAFDANRAPIYAAAMKAYKRERKASYELSEPDF